MKGQIDDFDDFGTDVTEQRVIGGRLHIHSGRNLATKVMSNGVEVIVKGDQTGFIGYGYPYKTPLLSPMRVSPRPITFPPSTVSRQYHLVETPGRPNLINHLLHSIVRSATPDMVTKTLITTFTYMTTVLENHSTVVNSREQIISNVVTEKFRSTISYTPNLKAEPSSIPPEMLESLYSSYLTNTLTTTYTYFNTFTAGTVPIVVTSRETVSNVVTMPAYLATPTIADMSFHSRVFETETYFTTFTFSKTLAEENSRVVTTMETVTQVVVTEALIPATSPVPLLTPVPQDVMSSYLTPTFESEQLLLRSRTQVLLDSMSTATFVTAPLLLPLGIHTAKLDSDLDDDLMSPTLMTDKEPSTSFMEIVPLPSPTLMSRETIDIHPTSLLTTTTKKIMEPVLIFATKTYYTTYTFFTTIMGEGTTTKVNSRTQVASNIVTEALSTAFDIEYVNALKSQYLAKHSTLLEITSSVKQIIPDKTESASLRTPVLMTQSVSHPHWPKDEDQMGILDATTTSSGSAEHFDEMKEGISHIVHVLSDTQSDEYEIVTPSQVIDSGLYSTIVTESQTTGATSDFEQVTLKDPSEDEETTEKATEPNPVPVKLTYSSISHRPTPPLETYPKPSIIKIKNPFDDPTLSVVTGPPKSVMYDDEDIHFANIDHHDSQDSSSSNDDSSSAVSEFDPTLEEPIYGDMNIGDISSLVDIYVNSMYNKNQLTSSSVVKTEDGLTLFPSILNKFDMGLPSSTSRLEEMLSSSSLGFITKVPASKIKSQIVVDPTQQIFNMLSEITADGHLPDYYDEVKEEESYKENYEDPGSKVYNITTFNPLKRPPPPQHHQKKPTSRPAVITTRTTTVTPSIKTTSKITTMTTIKDDDTPATKEAQQTSPTWVFKTTPQPPLTTHWASIKTTTETTTDVTTSEDQEEDTTEVTTQSPRNITIVITPRLTTVKPKTEEQDDNSPFVVKQDEQKDNKDKESEEPLTIKITSGGNLDDSEIVVSFSSKKPDPTKYTTRKPKPKITSKTQPPLKSNDHDDDDLASTTKIYALAPVREPGVGSSTSEESNDEDQEVDDKSEMDESDEVADFPSDRRPPPIPPTGSTGPSKSTLSGPGLVVGGGNTGSQIVSASSTGINWTPLLNLGALGLGGLGASTLTRLGPMFSSVAGYMKNALPLAAGIARNDTHHNQHRNERPYNRVPSNNNNGENGNGGKPYNNPMGPNFVRVNSGQSIPFNDAIPRRPIVTHANEPNFRPLSNNRDPDGPFHRFENGMPWPNNNFPPTHNYNFIPPNDAQPNLFSQLTVNKHGESQVSSSEQVSGPSKIKIVAGSPINALQNHHRPEIGSGEDGDNRRPMFPRPPPRSQDGPPHGLPWGEHIILPLPPNQKDDKENRPGQSRINLSGERRPENRPNFNSHEISSAEMNNFHNRPPSPLPPSIPLHSNEIRDSGPPTFLLHPHPQQSHIPPTRQSQSSEFISRHPPPDVQTIHVLRQPSSEITILASSSRKPPTLHHMDKVYYNNVELVGGNQNPLLTIEIENHDPDKPTPTTLTHSSTNFDEDKQRFPHPSSSAFPFENSAESHEHDSFVPPPRFPPTNSLHFLPTPPPMQRPPPQPNNNILNMRPFSSQQPPTIFGPTMPHPHEQNHFSKPPQDHSSESNIRPIMVQPQNDRRPFNPNNNQGNPNRPFRHNPLLTPPDGLRPSSRPPGPHSEENMSLMTDSSELNPRPHNQPVSTNQNPLFSNQRNPERNPNVGIMQQRPFNGQQQSNPSQNRFPGMMSNNNPIMSHPPPFNNRPNMMHPNSGENRPPFSGPPPHMFNNNFPPRNSQEHHHFQQQQNMHNHGPQQLFLPPFNQRPPAGSHEHPTNSHEFGNFAQPQQKQPILIPGFQNQNNHPWNSQENSQQQTSNEQNGPHSSIENHRPASSPTPNQSSHQQRPSTIFVVHESRDVPTRPPSKTESPLPSTTPRDEIIRKPSTQKLIIKEIPLTTTPKILKDSTSTTTMRTTNKATISKLNFIRRFTTPTTTTPRTTSTTTSSKPTASTSSTSKLSGFIASPTTSDILKLNTSRSHFQNNRFSGKIPTVLSANKGPVLTKFSFQSTTRKPFDASKHFKNVATGDPNFGQDFSGSEDAEHIIDPVNEQVIKSPFDSINQTNLKISNSATIPSTVPTSASTTTTTKVKSSSMRTDEPSSSEEQKILNSFGIPDGFLISTPHDFNDLWWPTTFKPKPTTTSASVDKNLANHRQSVSSSTPKSSINSATTFRNTVKPTTFRPNGAKSGSQNNNERNQIERDRNQLRRPLNEPSIVHTFYDDNVGIGDIKLKNVEIHKVPDFIRRPVKPGPTIPLRDNFDESAEQSGETRLSRPPQSKPHSDYSEEVSEEVKEIEKIRRPLTSSQESIIEDKGTQTKSGSHQSSVEQTSSKTKQKKVENEDGHLEKLPYPSTRLRPPAPPPHYNLDPASPPVRPPVLTAQQHQLIKHQQKQQQLQQQLQQQSNRPGPLETIHNIFRRPGGGGRPQQQRPDFLLPPPSPPLQSMMPPPPQQNLAILQNPGNRRPFLPPPHPPGRRPIGPNNNLIHRNPILVRQPGHDGQPVRTNIIRPPRPQLIPVTQQQQQQQQGEGDVSKLSTKPTQSSPSSSTKRPESSQEYSEEQENGSNEIIIDEVRSSSTTPKEGSLIIQNQQKSPEPTATTDGDNKKESVASTIPKPTVSDQLPAAAGDQEGSEEYYEEEDDENSHEPTKLQPKPQPSPTPTQPSPNRPIHAGGYLSNNNVQRPGLRRPGFPQQQGPGPRPQTYNGNNNKPFILEGRPVPPLKTEMEPPPPVQGNRQRLPLNNNNNGRDPIRFRQPLQGQPGRVNNNLRPNLLRPNEGLFKSRQPIPPQVTLHTIASVDDDNKIVATNVFTAILSSRDILRSRFNSIKPSETLDGAENILITPTTTLEGSEGVMSSSSVVKYTSGSLQTVSSSYPPTSNVNEQEDEEEDEENYDDDDGASEEGTIIKSIPSRALSRSVVRTVIKSTVVRTRGGASSITLTLTPQSSTFIIHHSDSSRQSTPPILASKTLRSPSSPTSVNEIKSSTSTSRFVMPSRRPFTKPPVQTSTTTTEGHDSENEVTEGPRTPNFPGSSTSRKPYITPGRNQTYSGFPPWSRRSTTTSSANTDVPTEATPTAGGSNTVRPFSFNNTRKFLNTRRPFGTTTTTKTTTVPGELYNETIQTDLNSDNQNINSLMRATTFRPFRRPGGFLNSLITTTPKLTLSSSTSQRSNGVGEEEKDKDTSENRRVVIVNKTPLEPSVVSSSTPPELESEEEEEDDYPPDVNVKSSVHVQISPTRVIQRGKPNRNTGLLSSSSRPRLDLSSSLPGRDQPLTTRFVTYTEMLTRTITETESTVISSSGQPMTHTIMITKTLPPQTLISTIVGTVTVVNSVDLKPTTVRTTIYAQPTIIVPSFTDTTENSRKDDEESLLETVLQGNIKTVGGGRGRHKGRLPLTTPTASLTTEASIQSNNKKGSKPFGPSELECISNCGYKGNQVCRRYANGTRSRCVCKPGYARMKNSIPCKPTFTYEMSIALSHMEGMTFDFRDLNNQASDEYQTFVAVTKDALDKAFLSTDVKSKYQGAEIMTVKPRHVKNEKRNTTDSQVGVDFLVQLSLNVTEDLIKTQLIRQLKSSNFSVGRGTGIMSTKTMSDFIAKDFDECSNSDFNDCSQDADCINIKGSFSCQCRLGYIDKSKKDLPGRECRVLEGCAECNYHGKCVVDSFGNAGCACFRWYGGAECQINLKVLLISIIVIGLVLFIMVLLCGIIVCRRQKPVVRERTGSGRFLRYRSPTSQATLERTAIMNDSCSSDGSQDQMPVRLPHHQSFTPDSLLMENQDKGMPRSSRDNVNLMNFSLRNVVMDQDRSLTVVIPRAKIRPTSRPPSRPNQSSSAAMGPDQAADLAASEQKLISYLDQGASGHKTGRATASSSRQSTVQRQDGKSFRKLSLQEQRKISTGALVSSGTEVSAQGGMRRRSTGLPLPDGDSTFRGSVSEVRSFDETVRSPAKPAYSTDQTSRASCYSCKPPSYCAYSESHGHTMAEKDGASTVYTTQGKLFRMSNDSDSNSLSD